MSPDKIYKILGGVCDFNLVQSDQGSFCLYGQ